MDKLQAMFELQFEFLERYHLRTGSTKDIVLAAIVELVEVLNETPWKSWKKTQPAVIDREALKEEIVDVQHFLIELCLANGITFDEFFEAFVAKNAKNRARQESGY